MVDKTLFSRREFMIIITAAAASYPISNLAASLSSVETHDDKEPWITLSAVQQHLLPSDTLSADSVGAKEIQALAYLQKNMHNPDFDKEENDLIKNGVTWLNDLAKKSYSKKFIQLEPPLKEKLLRRIETSKAGQRWLSTLLTYLIEALLTDPIYGGNPGGVGWKWLQHQAGFPRPPENKKYYKLNPNRYRKTKA